MRRGLGIVAVVLALGFANASAASATASTTPSTSTTSPPTRAPGTTTTSPPTTLAPPASTSPPTTVALLPAPPPFPLGDDFGRMLLVHDRDARLALAGAGTDIASFSQQLQLSQEHVTIAAHAQTSAVVHARVVALELVKVHAQIRALAVDAYMMGSSGQLTSVLSSFASAHDVVMLSRNLTLVGSSHDRLHQLVGLEQHEQGEAASKVRRATATLNAAIAQRDTAESELADARQRSATAFAAITQGATDEQRFFADATTSASPIMGPSLLTADELVHYVASLHVHPKLTVSLHTLAGYYISEGNAEGVRGDVAFAQSVLETGAFMFPGHGLLDPGDNNFAGIDACDSCTHGDPFKTALLGVRAQIQLLRVYADPSLRKITDFAHPLALLHKPHLGFTGHVQTWYALGGTWATGPNYGFHIYDIYMSMVALSHHQQ